MAYLYLIVLIGLILSDLAMLIFAEDIDIQMWMDEHVFHEPVYLHNLIFHLFFLLLYLFVTHLIFMFFKLFLDKNHHNQYVLSCKYKLNIVKK